jgi:hypothetical protein
MNEYQKKNFSELSIQSILSLDKNTKIYRPQLRTITGSVTAALLLSQIIYWFYKNKCKPFYKFKEKCDHKAYKDGDDWCTELCFTNREFDGALKKISSRIKKGHPKNLQSLVWYWTTSERITYYEVNVKLLEKELISVYGLSNETIKLNDKSADRYLNDKSADRYLNDKSADTYITQTTTQNTSKIIITETNNNQEVKSSDAKKLEVDTDKVKAIYKNQFPTFSINESKYNKSLLNKSISILEANLKTYNAANNISEVITLESNYDNLKRCLKAISNRIDINNLGIMNLSYFNTIIENEPIQNFQDDLQRLLSLIGSEQKALYYIAEQKHGKEKATEKLRNLLIKKYGKI